MKKHKEGFGCIYKLTNLINGDSYIGKDKSGDPENHRWKHHLKMAEKGDGSYVHSAIFYYDFQFSAEVIWRGHVNQLNWKETYYIKKFHTYIRDPKYNGGYNLTPGGDGWAIGMTHSEHTKKHLSIVTKQRYEDLTEHEKTSEAEKRSHAERPDRRAKQRITSKRRWETDAELCIRASNSQKLRYEDLTEHEKTSEAGKRSHAENPGRRKEASVSMKRHFEQPGVREKASASTLLQWENSTVRAAHTAGLQRYWLNPTAHEKASAAQVQSFAENPRHRKNISRGVLRSYKDSAVHERHSAALLRYHEKNPLARNKISARTTKQWAKKTPEERAEIGRKSWVTRRANAAKKGKK